MAQKQRVLAWCDYVLASTGFATVSRHVLAALHASGRYQIDQLAINYHGDFFDVSQCPYRIVPAKLQDSADPFGRQQFLWTVHNHEFDLVWVLADPNVIQPVVEPLRRLKADRLAAGQKFPRIIYYFPVDCSIRPELSQMIDLADEAVTYTQWAAQQVHKQMPTLKKQVKVIGHGADNKSFYPLDLQERRQLRARYLQVNDPQIYIWINVNRNLPRKDLSRSILAFSEFRKKVANSLLYLHCPVKEKDLDLGASCQFLGLQRGRDVLFPADITWIAGGALPLAELNKVYNCADAMVTTTLGEGWGLTITEAMSAGIPIVAPHNSSIPEIVGGDGQRGYVYECHEQIRIDNFGYRPMGRMCDIVSKMEHCHSQRDSIQQKDLLHRASQFAQSHAWPNVAQQWVELFDRCKASM